MESFLMLPTQGLGEAPMRGTWRGLGLLLVVPWLAACVSGPPVRLLRSQH